MTELHSTCAIHAMLLAHHGYVVRAVSVLNMSTWSVCMFNSLLGFGLVRQNPEIRADAGHNFPLVQAVVCSHPHQYTLPGLLVYSNGTESEWKY